ncbi:unnamed protein product [Phaedon cochleariae]|uniref:EF-hand domain-containing protein n=1 Tax=Phaedon cochleariae TaxID=80249 RepID=A0A9N9SDD0_PHACE|nr:unnamed protein product [Phaedon cochleariae]
MRNENEVVDLELSPLTGEDRKHQYYRSIFDKYDKNHSGIIELKELKELIIHDDDIPEQLVEKIYKAADQNKDGQIDFDEFLSMITSKHYKGLFQNYMNIYIRNVLPQRRQNDSDKVEIDGVYEESYTCCPPPIAMVVISAFELACYVMDEATEKDSTLNNSGVTAKMFIYNPYHREECWRFFTYMFVHIGYMHLAMNLFVQLALGVPLEMVHHWWRVLIVYFAGVIAGSLGTSVADPGVFLAGASGGVYALVTAHIAAILMNWKDMSFPHFQLLFFIILCTLDVGSTIYNRYWLDTNQNIGYTAHLAGALAGLLVGIWVLRNFNATKRESYLWWGAVLIYGVCMGVLVLMNVVWTDHFLKIR